MTVISFPLKVSELRRHSGNRLDIDKSLDLGGLAVSTASVPDGSRVRLVATVEAISDGVVLKGNLSVPWSGECRRCLEMTSGEISVEVVEIYKDRPIDDMLPIVDEMIDLGTAVRDAVLLSLPLAPLCRVDCAGPVPEEFPVVAYEEDISPKADPRWAALDELRFDADPESR
ncbi:MAG TPA: YceD family protein [Microthrixaceae bacterium]|nr:YceD family protein [Microthrixaceae bacterium]